MSHTVVEQQSQGHEHKGVERQDSMRQGACHIASGKESPEISVIVPVYNAAAYLRRSLDSLLAQEYKQWEAICVDDGSHDGSSALLDEYAASDTRFVVIHQKNSGVAAARNVGLDAACGKYLVFMDADDWYAPEALEVYRTAMQGGEVDIACSAFTCQYSDESKAVVREPYKHMPSGIKPVDCRVLKYIVCCGWGKAYRREVVEANNMRFDERMKLGEDALFVYRYLAHCRNVALEPAPLYNYFFAEDSAVQQGARGKFPQETYELNMRVPVLASDYMRKVVTDRARQREYSRFFLWYALEERIKWDWLTKQQPKLNQELKRCSLRYILVLAARAASISAWHMVAAYFYYCLLDKVGGFIRSRAQKSRGTGN